MKIHFSGVDFHSTSGPNSFAGRLAKQLILMGHDIVGPSDKHDVWLCFIQPSSYPSPGAKKVARFDGFWCSKKNFHENKPLKLLYDYVDDVVIQTEFDRKYMTKFFGTRDRVYVIGNGIDLNENVSSYHKSDSELRFICSSNWHPQKRLKQNIELFQRIRENSDKECVLVILGTDSYSEFNRINSTQKENVIFKGSRTHKECLMEYRTADWFIHLAYLDHFPNVATEALSQNCPIIYASSGGTREVVKFPQNGIMIEEKKEFDFELTDYDNPPELDISRFVLPEDRPIVDPSHLDIQKIAEQYIKVFEL